MRSCRSRMRFEVLNIRSFAVARPSGVMPSTRPPSSEMLRPNLPARVKKLNDCTNCRVKGGLVSSFVAVSKRSRTKPGCQQLSYHHAYERKCGLFHGYKWTNPDEANNTHICLEHDRRPVAAVPQKFFRSHLPY